MNNFPFVLSIRLDQSEQTALTKLAKVEGLPKSLVLKQTLHQAFRQAVQNGLLPSQVLKTVEEETKGIEH
jgi:predicted transcriptional regulator